MRTHKKITRHLLLRWSCGERDRYQGKRELVLWTVLVEKSLEIETESYCPSMPSSEKWGSWHPLSIISLAQSTKAPSSSTSFFSIWKQPSGYPILANCQGYFEEKRGRKKKSQGRRYLPNPHYPSVTGCSVPWFWETLPEAAKGERSLRPYLLQLICDLLQGEMKQYPRRWR